MSKSCFLVNLLILTIFLRHAVQSSTIDEANITDTDYEVQFETRVRLNEPPALEVQCNSSNLISWYSEKNVEQVDEALQNVQFAFNPNIPPCGNSADRNKTVIRVRKEGNGSMTSQDSHPLTIGVSYVNPVGKANCSWFREGTLIESLRGNGWQKYTKRHSEKFDTLTIFLPSVWDGARYTVVCSGAHGNQWNTSWNVIVEGDWEVRMSPERLTIDSSKPFEMVCRSRGVDDPKFQIYFVKCKHQAWDDCREKDERGNLTMLANAWGRTPYEVFYASLIAPRGYGMVVCEVTSSRGRMVAEAALQKSHFMKHASKVLISLLVIALVIIIGLIAGIFFLWFMSWDDHKGEEQKGAPKPAAEDSDPIAFLPHAYRFPREKVQLLEPLARQGEFGFLWLANVYGVKQDDPSLDTQVAAKEARDGNGQQTMAILLAELKTLVHVGHHLSVVNLLGAVVENCAHGEIMLILEYCQYGDLKTFLEKNKPFYENINDDGLFGVAVPAVGTMGYPFSQTDLLYWACQIASGMEFLGSKDVIHHNLAARNVLLCDGSVVKLCDFGTGQAVPSQDDKSLPLGWMAPESIRERLFTSSTDVWAYGMILWELFTLGSEPYSTIEDLNETTLIDQLQQGYRLEQPEHASVKVYAIMRQCWDANPDVRPSFKQLHTEFHSMLPFRLRMHYERLQKAYLAMNNTKNTPLQEYVNESVPMSKAGTEMPESDLKETPSDDKDDQQDQTSQTYGTNPAKLEEPEKLEI